VLDTSLSFVAPYIAFVPAQAAHASGAVAVVVTGLMLGHRAPVLQTAASRIAETTNWRTVQFLLENAVFMLIGLQLRGILDDVHDTSRAVWSCLAVLAATIVARVTWVFGVAGIYKVVAPAQAWSWRAAAVVSWAGMRGVVTLAAAFLLPPETPARDLLRLIAFAVVAGSLLQSLTLPWLIRRLGLRGPSTAEDALQYAALITNASRAGVARLEEVRAPDDPPEVLEQLRNRTNKRANTAWERLGRPVSELEPPSAAYRRLRMQMLDAERGSILRARDAARCLTTCCGRRWPPSTWRNRRWTASRTPRCAWTTSSWRRRRPANASTCAMRRTSPWHAPLRAVRSACATACRGCTCASACPAGTSAVATRRSATMRRSTSLIWATL